MISLSGLVWFVLYLIVGILILALLRYLNQQLAAKIPGYGPHAWIVDIAILVITILFLIGLLLHVVGGIVIFRA